MGKKTRIPEDRRRSPRHRGTGGRRSVPARGIADRGTVPRQAGGRLLAASVLGSVIALPVVAGAAAAGGIPSAGTASGPVRLTADIVLANGKIAPATSGPSASTGASVTGRVDPYPDILGFGGGAALTFNESTQNQLQNPVYLTLMAGFGIGAGANVTVTSPVTSGFGFGSRVVAGPASDTTETNVLNGTTTGAGTLLGAGFTATGSVTSSSTLQSTDPATAQVAQMITDYLANPQAFDPQTGQAIQNYLNSQTNLSSSDSSVSGRFSDSVVDGAFAAFYLWARVPVPVSPASQAPIEPEILDMLNQNGTSQNNAPQGAAGAQQSSDTATTIDGTPSWPLQPAAQPATTLKSGELTTGTQVAAQDPDPATTTTTTPTDTTTPTATPPSTATAMVSPTDTTGDPQSPQDDNTIVTAGGYDMQGGGDGTGVG